MQVQDTMCGVLVATLDAGYELSVPHITFVTPDSATIGNSDMW